MIFAWIWHRFDTPRAVIVETLPQTGSFPLVWDPFGELQAGGYFTHSVFGPTVPRYFTQGRTVAPLAWEVPGWQARVWSCACPLAYTTPGRGGSPPKGVCGGPSPRPHVSGFLTTRSRAASVCLHDVACKRYQTPDARTRASLAPLTGLALLPARMPSMQAQPVRTR